MAILLGILLLVVLYFYGRSISVQLTKSLREAWIYVLIVLAVVAIASIVLMYQ